MKLTKNRLYRKETVKDSCLTFCSFGFWRKVRKFPEVVLTGRKSVFQSFYRVCSDFSGLDFRSSDLNFRGYVFSSLQLFTNSHSQTFLNNKRRVFSALRPLGSEMSFSEYFKDFLSVSQNLEETSFFQFGKKILKALKKERKWVFYYSALKREESFRFLQSNRVI